jgi:hypothetical protein
MCAVLKNNIKIKDIKCATLIIKLSHLLLCVILCIVNGIGQSTCCVGMHSERQGWPSVSLEDHLVLHSVLPHMGVWQLKLSRSFRIVQN